LSIAVLLGFPAAYCQYDLQEAAKPPPRVNADARRLEQD
jgi:hypothetical protein